MKLVIGIPTAGRREQLSLTLAQIARQQVLPDRVIVCPASADDYDPAASRSAGCPVQVITGPRGSCAQRNAILDACDDADLILFIDDDFYLCPDYVHRAIELFQTRSEVVMATGDLIADGATGPGIGHEQALELIQKVQKREGCVIREVHNAYGCNLIARMSIVTSNACRFDETMPLYGWLEDVDFSRRLAPFGQIVKSSALSGVHLATKRGRTSGVRFGYSQIANPLYIKRKGLVSWKFAYAQLGRNFGSNLLRVFRPEPWVDRRGRLKGNFLAWIDLCRSRLDPMRITKMF